MAEEQITYRDRMTGEIVNFSEARLKYPNRKWEMTVNENLERELMDALKQEDRGTIPMKLMSDVFWRDLKQNLKGLDVGSIRKATIVLETQEPAMLYLEIIADKKSEGRLLTKTYELVEIETDEMAEFISVEDRGIETTRCKSLRLPAFLASSALGYR